jgi:RNase P subunit RPR2
MARKNRALKSQRRDVALQSQGHLLAQMNTASTQKQHQVLVRHFVKTSRRHRLRVPREAHPHYCKKCLQSHFSSSNFVVRIRAGQIIRTCKLCGYQRRIGGGPKSHRRERSE